MRITCQMEGGDRRFRLYKEKEEVGGCLAQSRDDGAVALSGLWVAQAWQGRGYGSFLLKSVLAQTGGFEKRAASLHRLPPPRTPAENALWRKFGFAAPAEGCPADGAWARRRVPDLSAVEWLHQSLTCWLQPGGFYVDATCGNGHDTLFLCRLAGAKGRVLALDIQPQAVKNTNERLCREGFSDIGRAVLADHARLSALAAPGSADCVLFNFGYLPGAGHGRFTTPATSLPALKAALALLKPQGVLALCLYSGGPNGSEEKEAVLKFLEALPASRYTVLICRFANWAQDAPLPCFVRRR